jgi:hypothetical protein
MPRRVLPLLAGFLTLGALASACGQAREQDLSSSPEADGPLTKQGFIARADAICERMNAESLAAAKRLKGRPPEEIGRSAIELHARAIAELSALHAPPGDTREIGAVLLHLRRLQAAMRLLLEAKGEDALPAVAGIAVEVDAVARAARRYGLFRGCGSYHENPGVQKVLREQFESKPLLQGPDGRPLRPRAPLPVPDIRRLASGLVPAEHSVLKKDDWGGGDPPSCVVIELALEDRPIAVRRAVIAPLAARAGWGQPSGRVVHTDRNGRSEGKWPTGLLVLNRDGYDATVWLAAPDCTPDLKVGDGPNPKATAGRCVDTIMVTNFR